MSASYSSDGWSSGSESDSSGSAVYYDFEKHEISFRGYVETDDDKLEANAEQPVKRKRSGDDEEDPSQIKRYKMTDEAHNEEIIIISDNETETEKDEEVINKSANEIHRQENQEVIISIPGLSTMDWKVQRNGEESTHTHLDTEDKDHGYYFEYVDENILIVREKKKNTKQKNRYEIISKESHDQGNEEVIGISDDETETEKDEEVINESANEIHRQENQEVIISIPGLSPMDWKVQRNGEESTHTHLDTEDKDHGYYFEYVDENILIVREKKKNTKQKNRYEIISKESHGQGNEEVIGISDDDETEINEIPFQEAEVEEILTREFQLNKYQFSNSTSVVNNPTVKEEGPTQNEHIFFNVDDEDFDWLMQI